MSTGSTTPSTPYEISIGSPTEEYEYSGFFPPFSPLQHEKGEYLSPQAQVVPDTFALETPPWLQEAQSVCETWTVGTPTSAQPKNKDSCPLHFKGLPNCVPPEEDDCKYPPQVLEPMDDTEPSPEPDVFFDPVPLLRFRQSQMERGIDGLHGRVNEKDKKLKVQEEAIKNLQMRVDKLDVEVKTVGNASLEHKGKIHELFTLLRDDIWYELRNMNSKMEDPERKRKARKRKLNVHESCVRKRYNTRSGKNG